MDAGSGITVVATGMLPMLLLAAAALTAPTALFLLWLYRRDVIRQMSATALQTSAKPAGMQGARVDSVPPRRVRYLDATEAPRGCLLYRRMRQVCNRHSLARRRARNRGMQLAGTWMHPIH